jgi:hypothetical protein
VEPAGTGIRLILEVFRLCPLSIALRRPSKIQTENINSVGNICSGNNGREAGKEHYARLNIEEGKREH